MTMCRIDPSAHSILIDVRDQMKMTGIANATLSSAIRRMNECYAKDELDK